MAFISTIDFFPFMVDEGCMIGEAPTMGQRHVASQMNVAMSAHGFMYVDNLGIEEEEVTRAFDKAHTLFELPESEKEKMTRWTPQTNRGYGPMRTQNANPTRSPDLHEDFVVKNQRLFEHDFVGTPEGFAETSDAFWLKCENAARRFLVACAVALDLPAEEWDFFSKTAEKFDLSALKFNHYPPCNFEAGVTDGDDGSGSIRIGEHTDFGSITLLFMDGPAQGLQVRAAKEGDATSVVGEKSTARWTEAPGRGGATAIVNSGALLAQWTNDRWKASSHRVVVPNAQEAARSRYTLPFFAFPDAGAKIEAHPSFVPEGEQPHYLATTSEEYLAMRLGFLQAKNLAAAAAKGEA